MFIQSLIQSDLIYAAIIVFFMGAIPFMEVWLAIPAGIAMGLNGFISFAAALIGNYLSLAVIVLTYHRAREWYRFRFSGQSADSEPRSVRHQRFKRLWNRYGLPVVALAAPFFIGTHLACVLAMVEASSWKSVLIWMAISLVLWSGAILLAGYYSIEFIRSFF